MFVTHRLEEASAICDRMTVLRDGRLAGHLDARGRQPIPHSADHREDGRPRRLRALCAPDRSATSPAMSGCQRPRPAHHARSRGAARHRPRRRRPRSQGRRNPRRRRPRRLRPHRAGPRHLRRRPHRRRHHHAGRQADRARIARRCHRARHRPRAGGPQAPGDLRRRSASCTNFSVAALDAYSATASASWPSGASARRWPISRRCCRSAWPRPSRRSRACRAATSRRSILARWLARDPKVLIVDEPTRGVDVGAKAEVHQILVQLAARGIAVMMISSELPEVLAVSDRIVTMRQRPHHRRNAGASRRPKKN